VTTASQAAGDPGAPGPDVTPAGTSDVTPAGTAGGTPRWHAITPSHDDDVERTTGRGSHDPSHAGLTHP
jgi:hypothetical protein